MLLMRVHVRVQTKVYRRAATVEWLLKLQCLNQVCGTTGRWKSVVRTWRPEKKRRSTNDWKS